MSVASARLRPAPCPCSLQNVVLYAGAERDRALIEQHEIWQVAGRGRNVKFTVLLVSYDMLLKVRCSSGGSGGRRAARRCMQHADAGLGDGGVCCLGSIFTVRGQAC